MGSLELDAATAARVRELARTSTLDARVRFVGAVQGADLDVYYDRADVFVLPTFYEGYGMAVAEAVAHGLPVVCSQTGALPELVDARSGVLVPPGDVDALAAALAAVIGEDAYRARSRRRSTGAGRDPPQTGPRPRRQWKRRCSRR